MKKYTLNLLIFTNLLLSQISIESTPRSFLSNRNFSIQEIIMPNINIEQIIEQEELNTESSIMKPYKFAETINVDLNMMNSGNWTILDDGTSVWQLKITYQTASYYHVSFSFVLLF